MACTRRENIEVNFVLFARLLLYLRYSAVLGAK